MSERYEQVRDDVMKVRRTHEELLTRWIGVMQEKGVPSNTIATSTGAVKSFYASNYTKMEGVYVPSGVPVRVYKMPSATELAGMIEIADERTAAWICCQKDSGISGEDLISLTLDNLSPHQDTLREQLEKKITPVHLFIEREKGMSRGLGRYDSFLGKDAVEALLTYVDLSQTKLFDVTLKTVQNNIKKVSKKILGKHITPHMIRKFFNTYMKLAKVNESVVEYWMGHSLGKVKAAYFIPPVPEQIKLYTEAYPNIALPR